MRGIKRGEKFKGSSSFSATLLLLLHYYCYNSASAAAAAAAAAATAENFSRLRPKAPHPVTAPLVHVGLAESRGSKAETQNIH